MPSYHPPYQTSTATTTAGGYSTITTSTPSYTIEGPVRIAFVFSVHGVINRKYVKWPCVPSLGDVVNINTLPSNVMISYYVSSFNWNLYCSSPYENSSPNVEIQLEPLEDSADSAHAKLRKELTIKRVLEALL